MDDPTLYSAVNTLQTKDVETVLTDYLHLLRWNENDVILDIGCGTGNVTCDILLPMLPESVKEVLATDVNSKMISRASRNYSHISEIKFAIMDIGADVPLELQGKFDHGFSFFCLHWIPDQRFSCFYLIFFFCPTPTFNVTFLLM